MAGIGHADVYPAGGATASGAASASGLATVRGYLPGGATILAVAVAAAFGVGSGGGGSAASAAGIATVSPYGSQTGGGGTAPTAPQNVTAFGDTYTGPQGSAFVLFAAPASSGGSAITGYVGTAYQGGVPISTTVINPSPIPTLGALSCRVDFPNLAAGTYQFSVHAVNAAGNSPESALSTAITVSAVISPYLLTVATGTGQRAGWSNYGGGEVWNDTTHVYPGETYSLSIVTGQGLYPYWQDPQDPAASGPYNLVPYIANGHFIFKVYLTAAYPTHGLGFSWRGNRQIYGQCGAGSTGKTVVDPGQSWVPGAIAAVPSAALANATTKAYPTSMSGSSNTATSITGVGGAATFNPGDFYEWSNSDIDFANGNNTVWADAYVTGGTWVVGWNDVAIPMSAFGLTPSTVSLGQIPNFIQELRIFNACGFTAYYARLGWQTT